MDVERTIEFILKSPARAEIRMGKLETRANASMDRIDRRLDATSKLIQHGMRMLVKIETKLDALSQAQKRTDAALAELAQAQKATEKSLKAFIDSLRHGGNGRTDR